MLRWTLSQLDLAHAASSSVAAEREQPNDGLAERGTIVHRRWSGSDPTVFIENQGIPLNVTCCRRTKGQDDPHLPGRTGALHALVVDGAERINAEWQPALEKAQAIGAAKL